MRLKKLSTTSNSWAWPGGSASAHCCKKPSCNRQRACIVTQGAGNVGGDPEPLNIPEASTLYGSSNVVVQQAKLNSITNVCDQLDAVQAAELDMYRQAAQALRQAGKIEEADELLQHVEAETERLSKLKQQPLLQLSEKYGDQLNSGA